VCIWNAATAGSSVAGLVIPRPASQRPCDYAGSDLASIYLSLPVEPGIHFRKENAWLDDARFHTKEAGDRWTSFTAIACWLLYLARPIVEDTPLPWQKSQQRLDAPAGSAEHLPIFALLWQSSSPTQKARKSARMVTRQAKNTKQRYAVVKKDAPQRLKWFETRLVRCCFFNPTKVGELLLSKDEYETHYPKMVVVNPSCSASVNSRLCDLG